MNARTSPLTNDDIQAARDFVAPYIEFQMYGSVPYRHHLEQVLALAIELGLPIEYLVAALLHDVMEDHGVTREMIAERFGEVVAALVDAVSGFGKNRRERKIDIIRKLTAFPRAIILKMIDRYCNFSNAIRTGNRSLISMYLNEMPDYSELFSSEPKMWAHLQELSAQAAEFLSNA